MRRLRLSASAQADIADILAWTQEQLGEAARLRYEGLIATALRDLATDAERPGSIDRPELGAGTRSWHLRLSRDRAATASGQVRRPRHLLIYRTEPGWVVIGRVLHDAMELAQHLPADERWA